ncbi:protein PSK SIMULATOR 1-like isoform X2 [Phragmites australis]|uniref:protein PSK SIMULATOR 1-like isoform X2 n=1 Tax=Phragmites australis TaxID=29695 RepID=UPI002D788126|nr:protein PSK SIMULATOR 1-like isoform X2 [Phragmites australis]
MGGLCSKVSSVSKSPSDTTLGRNQVSDHEPGAVLEGKKPLESGEAAAAKQLEEQQQQSFSFLESVVPGLAFHGGADAGGDAGFRTSPRLARSLSQRTGLGKARAGVAKVSEVSSILGRASTVGLEKAVEVLDTLGSSMTSLNASSGFVSSAAAKGNKISMLAFEVANTIVKGCNLMRSLSKPSIKHLKEVVFHSEGVQQLISKDMDELLKIAAADKREELEVFSKEVVRFGNHCKDPQWHNLDRYFEKWALDQTPLHHLKEDEESVIQKLITCAQDTADYHLKQKEQDGLSPRGESLHILKQEVKDQTKHVKCLKKRSLWSKNLEEVMEKLVDIVHFLHLEIDNAFGHSDSDEPQEHAKCHNRLGPAGLALHYANIINQIDNLVSRSCAVLPNARATLYHGLPQTIKSALRSKLQSFQLKEELTASQIKAEMEKTLRWLVPFANNTTKAHHGFGWVGEWANTGSELNCKLSGQMDSTRIETLYHAEKEKTEALILELVVWLHHLISKSRNANGGLRSPIKSPLSSPTQKGIAITLLPSKSNNSSPILTQEDQDMLRDVRYRKFVPGISKSQEFDTKSRHSKQSRLSKSNSHSPASGNRKDLLSVRRSSMLPVIDFEIDRTKALDLIDRLDDLKIH